MTQRGRAAGRPTAGRSTAGRSTGGRPQDDLAARRLRLRTVIEPVLAEAGYDLEDLAVARAGRRHLVRVIVDGDGGVSLDAVADVSRAVSAALDRAEESGTDLIAGEYQLEVSSPGVDRPLTLPRHWRRNVGRLVRVTAKGPGVVPADSPGTPGQRRANGPGGDRQVTGRVIAADAERVVFDIDGTSAGWAYPDLGPGRVQIEFNRPGEPADEDDVDDEIDEHEIDAGHEFDDEEDDEDVEGEER